MTDDDGTQNGWTARLRDVFFSYDPDASLPDDGDESVSEVDGRRSVALRGVDADVTEGGVTVVLGASASGKSTLVQTLNAIVPSFVRGQFRGDVRVLGRDATTAGTGELAPDVGLVLQDYEAHLFRTSVETEVAFGPENLGVPPSAIDDRIESALRTVGLDHIDRRRDPRTLSGGQKQRLALAGALAMQPDLLVLDEPGTDLDPRSTRELLRTVESFVADGTASPTSDGWHGPDAAVVTTHSIRNAVRADRALLLEDGRVVRKGDADAVFRDVDALRRCRVEVPPLVAAFSRLGWSREELPLLPSTAEAAVRDRGLVWNPPARRGDRLPGVPAGTGDDLGNPVFELEGVTHRYDTDRGTMRALADVDLSVCEGEVLALVGANGSGKTTLAKHLNGLLEPDEGTVRVRGRDVAGRSTAEMSREVGYLFQNPDRQLFASTVREEVAFGPKNDGVDGEELDRRVYRALEAVDLEPVAAVDPFDLSRGQRQRVALASVLAADPDAVVLDEPTTGLDVARKERFMDLIARLNRETGLTVIVVTHGLSTVVRYAPRTVVLRDGTIVADAPTRELFADADVGAWDLVPPHVVDLSNRLADADGLPALSVAELVAALEGER